MPYTTFDNNSIVASDGSIDRTNEIVRKFEKDGVKLLKVVERKGKENV